MPDFTYQGNQFQALRNLTVAERGQQNIERRTGGYQNTIAVSGYSYDGFYRTAEESGCAVDLYLMDGTKVAIPHTCGLLRYDETVGLQHGSLAYFSGCCGKMVGSHKRDAKEGLFISGRIPATENYYCPRCKREVTKTGGLMKTRRNYDIAQNGSWGYTLEPRQNDQSQNNRKEQRI